MFSFALTVLEFGLKGTMKLIPYLKQEWAKENPKKKPNLSRISQAIIGLGWRPDVQQLVNHADIEMPKTVADLIEICWSMDTDKVSHCL